MRTFSNEINQIIKDFSELGKRLKNSLQSKELDDIFLSAENQNPWFTRNYQELMITNIIEQFLTEQNLNSWISNYIFPESDNVRNIGIVAAGNIPLVCFHDVICVLISGNNVKIKLSSKDEILPKYIFGVLSEINPDYKKKIDVQETLKGYDAIIATGSNNTSRYFEFYFKSVPNLLRKNRTSIAVLKDSDAKDDYFELGKDIFQYYGLGCRNVSKIFIPEGFNVIPLLDELFKYHLDGNFFKYYNNYTYHKSIFLLNKVFHYDTGFLVFKEDEKLFSPLGVVFFEFYKDLDLLQSLLETEKQNIQCIVSNINFQGFDVIGFGKSQIPTLSQYADGVDTIDFLLNLH